MTINQAGSPDGMIGREGARRLLHEVLRQSSADQTEVVLSYERQALTRFAEGYVHQNVLSETPTLTVRAVFGRRSGVASTSRVDAEGMARVVEQAATIARLSPENSHFPGLPGPATDDPGEAIFSESTAKASPMERAAAAGTACRLAHAVGLVASGSVTTMGQEIAVANSLGVFAYTPRSSARIIVTATGPTGSGYAEENAVDLAALDAETIAGKAGDVGRRAQDPIAIDPGDYTVILQPAAVADMMLFLSIRGFGAQEVDEGRSFVAGKRGEQVLGENVTIYDDGHDPMGLPLPFDHEGQPRRRLALIERGIAGDIALDSYWAARMGTETNGHALPSNMFGAGPIPQNVFMAPGSSSVADMIAGTERGLLVTHFHYTRIVHPLHVIITGMTRDGTFLIEHGEVTRPVKNLRFTQSYLEALRDVQAISRETSLTGMWFASRTPALKIGRFTFTGVTQ